MTPGGTLAPARAFIMGVGVAGLQAIATARRLGALVTATDVRPATKEQVRSLGGKFVAVEDEEVEAAETAGGYAKADEPGIPGQAGGAGRRAPQAAGHRGDHSAYSRPQGACAGERGDGQDHEAGIGDPSTWRWSRAATVRSPNSSKTVEKHGVKIVGPINLPAELPTDTSALFARNLLNFITPHGRQGGQGAEDRSL